VAGVTARPVIEYTPTLISTSWTIAKIAESAIFHSNRHAMNTETRTKKISSARTAFSVMLRPQDELTDETLTS
jgi:hypothetical protein